MRSEITRCTIECRSVETISHVYIGYPTKRILALDVAKEERRGKGLKITIKNYEGPISLRVQSQQRDTVTERCNYRA